MPKPRRLRRNGGERNITVGKLRQEAEVASGFQDRCRQIELFSICCSDFSYCVDLGVCWSEIRV